MVKSKKMSKSTVAIVLLSLLLVLSLILTATGAWFTDSAKGTGSTNIAFGKVDVNVNGTATLTKTHEGVKTVDGCSWTISGLTLENASDVDVYYAYAVTVEVEGSELTETEKGYFTVNNTNTGTTCTKLTAGTAAATLSGITVDFDSEGAMNGSEKAVTIKVTVKIAAIQADHITESEATTELANLLAAV